MSNKLAALEAQLKALQDAIEREKTRDTILGQLNEIATKAGFSLRELVIGEEAAEAPVKRRGRPAGGAPKEKGEKVVKYRKGTQEWSGRGRRPGWFTEAEAAGENMGKYLVMGADA